MAELYIKIPSVATQLKFTVFFWLPGLAAFFSTKFYSYSQSYLVALAGIAWIGFGAFWSNRFGTKRDKIFCHEENGSLVIKPDGWINCLKVKLDDVAEMTISRRRLGEVEVSVYMRSGYCHRFFIRKQCAADFSYFIARLGSDILIN